MSYVKYGEDNSKIVESGQFMEHGSEFPKTKREPVHYYDCKYCHAIFTDRGQLFLHIKQRHNQISPLVVINGKVANDQCVIHYLESASIDLFGYEGQISLNDHSIRADDADEIDITDILNRELSASAHCCISFGDASIEVDLVAYSIGNHPAVIEATEQWEKDIAAGQRLTTLSCSGLDEGSRLYLTGIYNYYVASRAKKDKSKRYDDALATLSCLQNLDGMGHCVMEIIAFRRNWISRLDMLTADRADFFSVATDYFHLRKSDVQGISTGKQIYIEDSTMLSLDLILLFQRGEYDQLRTRLSEIDIDDLDDPNLADQLNLLCARLAVLAGDQRRADYHYEKLGAPAFRDEYALFKKGALQILY